MRRIILASLLMSTVLLPAQTATKGQGATLVAVNNAASEPAAASAASSLDSGDTTQRRVSTGVIAPKLLTQPKAIVIPDDFIARNQGDLRLLVSMRVDENGIPQNVQLVRSAGYPMDERVLAAVRAFRYEPAKLDNQAVPIDMNLIINFAAK